MPPSPVRPSQDLVVTGSDTILKDSVSNKREKLIGSVFSIYKKAGLRHDGVVFIPKKEVLP